RQPVPALPPVRNRMSEIAAMPVDAPDARKSAPISRASLQNGRAELESSTPVSRARKYQTISIPQSGVLSIATSGMAASVPARAEREQRSETDHHRRADREQRVDDDLARRELGIYGQVVRLRFGEEQEERIEPAEETVLIRPVELRVLE